MTCFYHYTCTDSAVRIRAAGYLRPWPQVTLDRIPLIWLTDMDVPLRAPLGLTSKSLACDRTEVRVTVDCDPYHWPRWARTAVRPEQRRALDDAPGAMPMHWWIATTNLPVLDITTKGARHV